MRRLALLVTCALVVGGCGLGEGDKRGRAGAELRVTRDFGRAELGKAELERLSESSTVMRLLRSEFEVQTRFGGRFVQSIDGLAGRGEGGRRDWFYFVNGLDASVGATEYGLSPGDRVQWDHRNWEAAMRVPAIVGAYPEPFEHGRDGKRFPVRLECDDVRSRACEEVKRSLGRSGIATSGGTLGAGSVTETIRVVVALWEQAKVVRGAALIEEGPARSGVFARFAEDGRSLALLGEDGRPLRRVRPGDGTGIVAATRPEEEQIVWVVTGLDDAGVEAAARALEEKDLSGAFAVAAGRRGVEKLPLISKEQ